MTRPRGFGKEEDSFLKTGKVLKKKKKQIIGSGIKSSKFEDRVECLKTKRLLIESVRLMQDQEETKLRRVWKGLALEIGKVESMFISTAARNDISYSNAGISQWFRRNRIPSFKNVIFMRFVLRRNE
ncbi:hypothetical protein CAEBREN_28133 [Caenorhabditis brenneri]|uniref:Uncharacterized protein n=1 Tax=Caenorhabditis brenneri TaxID=135651 RepID=G0MJX5_CAEBE|nr:hypothetical protein CAEBREN_28133 [Caenorhabditis brenneri]